MEHKLTFMKYALSKSRILPGFMYPEETALPINGTNDYDA
jgi:hypothetical protein